MLVYAEMYRISDVNYTLHGITREYALKTNVPVDKKRVFEDEDELINYIDDIKQQIENTRTFETVNVDFAVSEPDENLMCNVIINVETKDSFHFIATPYPKYTSGDSMKIMIKAKDTNFLGSMESLTGDVNFEIELNEDDSPKDFKFGFGVDFDTPFKMGIFDAVWGNSLDFTYTIGDSSPEWDFDTGLKLTKNFNKFSIITKLNQVFARNLDYDEKDVNGKIVKYGDGTYFGEKLNIMLPITLQEVDNWGKILYTPFFGAVYFWDFDGIDKENTDLRGPVISFGQTLSTGRVNWEGNFRNGIIASVTNSYAYNFSKYFFVPSVSGEFRAYKAFNRFALYTDIYGFAVMNGTYSFGERLRGIRDEQYFDTNDEHQFEKACYSAAALVVNIDMPIRICKIYWEDVPVIKKLKFSKYFNLEAQVSPFVDFALFHNEASDTAFNPKDGFLAGGIEGIVYPLRWRGIQVRGSLGVDLSRKMPKVKGFFNQDWRDNVKAYELTIGLGLHY